MNSYNKKAVNLAAFISTLGAIFGIGGWWLTQEYVFMNVGFIIIGLQAIYFSRDLAMERVVNYKINYKFARGAYLVIGAVFVFGSIIWLLKGYGFL